MRWVLSLLLACSGEQDDKDRSHKWSKEEPAMLVKTEDVILGEVADHLEVTGTLESTYQANIVPETSGTVQKVIVREGDPVEKGQLLAQLINPNIEASYERSQIDLAKIKRESIKAQQLHQQGAISDRELQEADSALQTAETASNEAIAAAQTTAIRSPINGVVATVNIREGEVVNAAQVFQVVDLSQLRLVASVPERDLSLLKQKQPVVVAAAYDETAKVEGYIERIAPVVDPTTGSVKVFINLQMDQQTLRPGQFVKARIEIDRHSNTIIVNKAAIIYDDGTPIAYVVVDAPEEPEEPEEPETESQEKEHSASDHPTTPSKEKAPYIAERRELELGYSDTKMTEIYKGLSVGEKVVTAGNSSLEDKSPLKLTISDPDSSEEESK